MLFVMSGVFMQVTVRQQIICVKIQHIDTNDIFMYDCCSFACCITFHFNLS